MSRQSKELQTRWDGYDAEDVLQALIKGKPVSPFGVINGRVDLRGMTIDQPGSVRESEYFNRISKVFRFAGRSISNVDLSYSVLPEWRIADMRIENSVFIGSRLPSLRVYSSEFVDCAFVDGALTGASLTGRSGRSTEASSRYVKCDFTRADLRKISVDGGYFVDCSFRQSRWRDTRTMSAVFEDCDFSEALLQSVHFDGRMLGGPGKPNRLGQNSMRGCNFSTAKLEDTSFYGVDFRNLTPPTGEQYLLYGQFPSRTAHALELLKAKSSDSQIDELAYRLLENTTTGYDLLPGDAVGLISRDNFPPDIAGKILTAMGSVT